MKNAVLFATLLLCSILPTAMPAAPTSDTEQFAVLLERWLELQPPVHTLCLRDREVLQFNVNACARTDI